MSTRDLLILTGLLPLGLVVLAFAGSGLLSPDADVFGWICVLVGGGVLVMLVVRTIGKGPGG
jgi:hypothetical protein